MVAIGATEGEARIDGVAPPWRRVAPAFGLFVLSPLIGECLLGNLTVTEIFVFLLPLLAPMYGGGTLLIREVARVVVTMHAVWSTNVAIVLAEALVPERADTPWLGSTGLIVTGAVFVAGTAFVAYGNHAEEHFMASPARLLGSAVVVVVLVLVAFRLRPKPPVAGPAPRPWLIGALALVAAVLFLQTEQLPGWRTRGAHSPPGPSPPRNRARTTS